MFLWVLCAWNSWCIFLKFNECRYRHLETESQQSQSTSTKRQRVLAATEVKTAQIPSWTSQGPLKLTAHCPPIQIPGPTFHPPSGPLLWPSSSSQDQKPNSTRLILIITRSRKKASPTCFVVLMISLDFGRGWNNPISIEMEKSHLLVGLKWNIAIQTYRTTRDTVVSGRVPLKKFSWDYGRL